MNNTTVLRIAALDIVRGIAILGTLWTNIWIFTDYDGFLGATNATPPLLESFIVSLSQGKFLALLSLLFGIGMAIQFESAVRRQLQWPGRYLRRMLLLLIDGALNYIFIAEFDILMGYAVTGFVVAFLLAKAPKIQKRVLILATSLHLLLMTAAALALEFVEEPESEPLPTPYATGSYAELIAFRIENIFFFRAEPLFIFPLTVALFLLGAKLYHAGILQPDKTQLRKRLLILGAIAFPIDIAFGTFGTFGMVFIERYVIAPFVALGLLALIINCCHRFNTNALPARLLSSVGRCALSCYLLQNLLGMLIFYGVGLGLVNYIQGWHVSATILGYIVIASLVTAFAHFWMKRFRHGPAEWVWKQLG